MKSNNNAVYCDPVLGVGYGVVMGDTGVTKHRR